MIASIILLIDDPNIRALLREGWPLLGMILGFPLYYLAEAA